MILIAATLYLPDIPTHVCCHVWWSQEEHVCRYLAYFHPTFQTDKLRLEQASGSVAPSESWKELRVQPSLDDFKRYPLSLKSVASLRSSISVCHSFVPSIFGLWLNNEYRLWRQLAWVQTLVLPLASYMCNSGQVTLLSDASVSTSMPKCWGDWVLSRKIGFRFGLTLTPKSELETRELESSGGSLGKVTSEPSLKTEGVWLRANPCLLSLKLQKEGIGFSRKPQGTNLCIKENH